MNKRAEVFTLIAIAAVALASIGLFFFVSSPTGAQVVEVDLEADSSPVPTTTSTTTSETTTTTTQEPPLFEQCNCAYNKVIPRPGTTTKRERIVESRCYGVPGCRTPTPHTGFGIVPTRCVAFCKTLVDLKNNNPADTANGVSYELILADSKCTGLECSGNDKFCKTHAGAGNCETKEIGDACTNAVITAGGACDSSCNCFCGPGACQGKIASEKCPKAGGGTGTCNGVCKCV